MNTDTVTYIVFGILFFIVIGFIFAETIRKYIFDKNILKNISSILSNNEFENLYNKLINSEEIKEVIKEQKILKAEQILGGILTFIGLLGIVLLFPLGIYFSISGKQAMFFCFLFIAFIVISAIVRRGKSLKYKNVVINEIATTINPSIKYQPIDIINIFSSPIFEELYLAANFNDIPSNQGSSADYLDYNEYANLINLQGSATDYMEYAISYEEYVKLIDLHLKYQIYSPVTKSTQTINGFEGIVAKISRNKFIDNEILIVQNKILKPKNHINYNDEFDKYFDVSASNIDNCQIIISENIKRQLLHLQKKYGIGFDISIKGNNLFIRFSTKKLFEAKPPLNSLINKKKLYKDYVTFKVIILLIEYINNIL